jgi:hypothetical protein
VVVMVVVVASQVQQLAQLRQPVVVVMLSSLSQGSPSGRLAPLHCLQQLLHHHHQQQQQQQQQQQTLQHIHSVLLVLDTTRLESKGSSQSRNGSNSSSRQLVCTRRHSLCISAPASQSCWQLSQQQQPQQRQQHAHLQEALMAQKVLRTRQALAV